MRCLSDRRCGVLRTIPSAVLAVAVLSACGCSDARIPPPPETRVGLVVDTLHGVAIPDPYRWLEDTHGPEIPPWVEAQNAYAEQILGNPPVRAWLEGRLREMTDRDDVGSPQQAGDYEYFTLRRKGEPATAIYRRPAPAEGDTTEIDPTGEYEKVLDPLEWSPDGTTSLGMISFSEDGKLLLYNVRDGGPDEYAVRLRDLERGEDLPDHLPPALYSGVAFTGDGSGFYYTRRSRDPDEGTRVLLHRIGADMATDAVLFGEGYGPSTYLDVREVQDGRNLLYAVRHGWASSELYIQDREGGALHAHQSGRRQQSLDGGAVGHAGARELAGGDSRG
jgi:prolyl oligopeptidase